jgi:CheY-like chemotaxis protein
VTGPDGLNVDPTTIAGAVGQRLAAGPLPIIVYGDGDDPVEESSLWKQVAEVAVVKRVHSPERLLDHATRFLHRPIGALSERQRATIADLHQSNRSLAGKKVLIVDDDMRNIFALSTVLEEHQMTIASAINGRDAIQMLRSDPTTDVVLMDIMMPDMDGFETMREIRKIPALRGLPIIAVTAKAMKGDRERCIEAGAWDYLSKPVDAEQMLAVLRAWLHR